MRQHCNQYNGKATNDHDSAAPERLSLASNEHKYYHDYTYALFQPKKLSAIAALRLKHKRIDTNSIYEHFPKIEACNADKEFIEGVILQIIKDGIIINKKSTNWYDSFYRKLSNYNDNINPSQQPATNTQSHFLNRVSSRLKKLKKGMFWELCLKKLKSNAFSANLG